MNDGVIGTVFSLAYVSLKGFGVVGSNTYTWGIKDFHKCWLGSLAKRRLCLGPAGVINCTPLSALSFWVSLFPGTRGYNTGTVIPMLTTLRQCGGYLGTPVIQGALTYHVSVATYPSIQRKYIFSVPQLGKGGESDSKVHNFHTRLMIQKKKDFRLPAKYNKVTTHIHSSSSSSFSF